MPVVVFQIPIVHTIQTLINTQETQRKAKTSYRKSKSQRSGLMASPDNIYLFIYYNLYIANELARHTVRQVCVQLQHCGLQIHSIIAD